MELCREAEKTQMQVLWLAQADVRGECDAQTSESGHRASLRD
jgi:hypothetical protein